MNYSKKLTKSFLKTCYIKKKMSTMQIAKRIGCARVTISYYLKKHNIKIREFKYYWRNNPMSLAHREKIKKALIGKKEFLVQIIAKI